MFLSSVWLPVAVTVQLPEVHRGGVEIEMGRKVQFCQISS